MNGWLEIREFAGMLGVLAALLLAGAGLKTAGLEPDTRPAAVRFDEDAAKPDPTAKAETGVVLESPAETPCPKLGLRG
jgi:hypothetical protein